MTEKQENPSGGFRGADQTALDARPHDEEPFVVEDLKRQGIAAGRTDPGIDGACAHASSLRPARMPGAGVSRHSASFVRSPRGALAPSGCGTAPLTQSTKSEAAHGRATPKTTARPGIQK